MKLDSVSRAFNSSIQEAERQEDLCEFWETMGYVVRAGLEKAREKGDQGLEAFEIPGKMATGGSQ